jgi:PPOX class probable F420-dependent enzyme
MTAIRTIPAGRDLQADATSLRRARFIDLVTYRRDGTPVGTPVLFAIDHERLLVRTAQDAGKLKRLAHTARVELAPSDSRGRRIGPTFTGVARVLGPEAVAPALALIHRKHRIAGPLSSFIRHRRGQADVIIEITLDGAAPADVAAGEPIAAGTMTATAPDAAPVAGAMIHGTWVDLPAMALAAALSMGA